MVQYTRRIQAVLTEDQHELLCRLSAQRGTPISALVREAIETTYVQQAERARRLAALAELLSLDAPAADWPEMESDIERGVVGD